MTAAYLPLFFEGQLLTNAAAPASLYYLYSYESGTTTPKDTYTSAAGNVANTNPIHLDSAGRLNLWLGTGGYSFELRSGLGGALIKRWDNVTTAQDISAAIIADLANRTDALKNAGMVGYDRTLNYAYGTIGAKLSEGLSIADFKVGATDIEAFEAAVAYAHTLISTPAYNDRGINIEFPPGIWDLQGISTVAITKSRIGIVGRGGAPGATLIRHDGALFDVGDYTDAVRVRGVTFANLTFYCTDLAGTEATVKQYRTTGTNYDNVQFINGYIDIDTYHASTTTIFARSQRPNRTTAGLAVLRAQGTDESLTLGDTYTPGGGFHIDPRCEFSGSSTTVDTTNCFLLMSCDGFYLSPGAHIVGYEKMIAIEPAATPENYVIVEILIGGCYFDQPSIFAANPYQVSMQGTVKKTITLADGTVVQSRYRSIRAENFDFRASGYGKHCVFMAITDGDTWGTTATEYLQDISFIGGSARQALDSAFQINGAAQGCVEPRGFTINGTVFSDNNQDGFAGKACDINGAFEQALIANTVHGNAGSNAHDYVISALISDAGATDNTNPAVSIVNPDFSRITGAGAPQVKYINITPSEANANTQELGALFPGRGKELKQAYKNRTTDASAVTTWTYTIPEGVAGYIDVKVIASSTGGARYAIYTWTVAFQRDTAANVVMDGGAVTAGRTYKDGTTPAPTFALATNTFNVGVTGVAATVIDWTTKVEMTLSR